MNKINIYQQKQISDFRFYKYNIYLYKSPINTSKSIKMIMYYYNEIFCNEIFGLWASNKNVLIQLTL